MTGRTKKNKRKIFLLVGLRNTNQGRNCLGWMVGKKEGGGWWVRKRGRLLGW